MSNFIPMVSSSPPPLDDGPSFDDWAENEDDEDDFGGFATAGVEPAPFQSVAISKPSSQSDGTDQLNSNVNCSETVDNWASFGNSSQSNDGECSQDFADFTSGTLPSDVKNVHSEFCSDSNDATVSAFSPTSEDDDSAKILEGKPSSSTNKADSQDSTSQGSMTDSGMCSDISPVPRSEEYCAVFSDSSETKAVHKTEGDRTPTCPQEQKMVTEPVPCDDEQTQAEEDREIADFAHTFPPIAEDSSEPVAMSESEEDTSQDNDESRTYVETEPLDLKPASYTGEEGEGFDDMFGEDSFEQFHECVPNETTDKSDSASELSRENSVSVSLGSESESEAGSGDKRSEGSDSRTTGSDVPDLTFRKDSVNEDETVVEATALESDSVNDADQEDFGDFAGELKTAATGDPGHEEDDFGDFAGEFEKSEGATGEAGGDSEWAAFGSAAPEEGETGEEWAAFSEPAAKPEGEEEAEDWAAFSEPPVQAKDDDDEFEQGDDDFQAFEDAPQPPAVSAPPLPMDKVLESCFPNESEDVGESDLPVLLKCIDVPLEREQQVVTKPNPSAARFKDTQNTFVMVDLNVWNNLKDMEHTCALKYQWSNSVNKQTLLRAVNIDTRNLLIGHKKPSMPIFASSLGLLEPSRDPGPRQPTPPTAAPAAAPAAAASPSAPAAKAASPAGDTAASGGSSTPQVKDIPPAEFDWSSSGLTNPLDGAESKSVLEKEKELLAALESPRGAGKHTAPLPPLENLLSGLKLSSVSQGVAAGQPELGTEAKRVVDELPLLSFMHATVLMFPLKDVPTDDRPPAEIRTADLKPNDVVSTDVKPTKVILPDVKSTAERPADATTLAKEDSSQPVESS